MSLPPLNPQKTAAGIVVDPKTLDRVIPSSKRADGTTRKQVKIRPGFTPEEDVGRFRSSRQKAAEAARGGVPGSRPPAPRQLSDLVNQSSWDSSAPPPQKTQDSTQGEAPKSVKKDWTEKDLKETNFRWDEESDDDGEDLRAAFAKVDLGKGASAGSAANGNGNGAEVSYPPLGGGGGAPKEGITQAAIDLKDDKTSGTTAAIEPAAPAPSASTPETASELPTAPSPKSQPHSIPTRPNAPPRQPSNRQGPPKQKQKPHPIQGGRKGPIGLAFPPPLSPPAPTEPKPQPVKQLSRSDAADSWRAAPKPKPQPQPQPQPQTSAPAPPKPTDSADNQSQAASDGFQPARNGRRRGKQDRGPKSPPLPQSPQSPPKPHSKQGRDRHDRQEQRSNAPSSPEQRVRKEVRVRQGGATDASSLANRVRNLVLENQPKAPRDKSAKGEEAAPAPAST